MTYARLKVDRAGAVAHVSLSRPEVRNAFDSDLIRELGEAFTSLARDDSARVIVLSGEGKVFCAGADVNWMRASMDLSESENREDALRLARMLHTLDQCPKPVIGRIHGAAMGGGSGLVATCDIVVASEETKFAFSEVKLGIVPAVISSFVLPRIGAAHARRYFLTAEVFSAAEAHRIGLIHETTTAEKLDSKVQEICGLLLNNGPNALREAKALIRRVLRLPQEEAIPFCSDLTARIRTSPEGQEGLRAFLEKRAPSWMCP